MARTTGIIGILILMFILLLQLVAIEHRIVNQQYQDIRLRAEQSKIRLERAFEQFQNK